MNKKGRNLIKRIESPLATISFKQKWVGEDDDAESHKEN
jgi:hypothetical protein